MNSKLILSIGITCLIALGGWILFAPDTTPPARMTAADHVPDTLAGAATFKRYCTSCHVVVSDDGETFAGDAAQAGPNLYGVTRRPAGSVLNYRYSSALADAGFDWTIEAFVAYVQNPYNALKVLTDDPDARSKMAFRLRGDAAAEQAADIYAWLEGL